MSGSTGESGVSASLVGMLSTYSIAELVYFVRNMKLAQTNLLDMFFPNIIESDAPEVAIDVDNGKRRMAPFCSPLVEGKLVESRQWQTNLFKPAYIKDWRNPDLLKPVRRAIGERLMGAMSPAERLEANLAWEMADQVDMINRRLEWMAASALVNGSVTIVGDGYPNPIVVDFQRDPALKIALTGAAQWGQTGIYPSDYLLSWATTVLQKSGAAPTDIILTNSPFNALKSDMKFLNSVIWAGERTGGSSVDLGGRVQTGRIFMGKWGQFNIWLYNDWYVDPVTDKEEPMIPDGTIVMSGPGLEGTRAFGLILDPAFAYGPLAYAPKIWYNENPATINLLMQSAPIVIPSRVNACLSATVMEAGADAPAPAV
ncbi:major capsid protein [Acetobacter persici]|uniref:major capsid protein n=1 Tax=Acetobacter persici TaxID=1076596 RepID=UPI001BADCC6C|nr:major capsid protein [Acetobacter persici]MBS1014484.1 major capsid protein [Acetobacter persici]